MSLSLSHWYPGSGVVLDCIDSWSLHPYLLSISFVRVTLITFCVGSVGQYSNLRSQHIKRTFWKIPNMLWFIELMTYGNLPDLQIIACYVYSCISFELRNAILYRR